MAHLSWTMMMLVTVGLRMLVTVLLPMLASGNLPLLKNLLRQKFFELLHLQRLLPRVERRVTDEMANGSFGLQKYYPTLELVI